ncbi:MAG: TetR/AcrR family transcriptional regulator [Bryobacteraceae bacterium]
MRPEKTDLRQRLRDVARELFAKEGYDSVSMRRIGAEANCSAMATYRYFRSKEELLISICEETFEQLSQSRNEAMKPHDTPLERLRAAMRNFIQFGIEHPNHYKLAFMTDIPPGPMATRRATILARGLGGIRDLVKECAAAKDLGIDVDLTVELLQVAPQGLISACVVRPPQIRDSNRLVEHMIQTLTRVFE